MLLASLEEGLYLTQTPTERRARRTIRWVVGGSPALSATAAEAAAKLHLKFIAMTNLAERGQQGLAFVFVLVCRYFLQRNFVLHCVLAGSLPVMCSVICRFVLEPVYEVHVNAARADFHVHLEQSAPSSSVTLRCASIRLSASTDAVP
jgi:hypothetical protein